MLFVINVLLITRNVGIIIVPYTTLRSLFWRAVVAGDDLPFVFVLSVFVQ